MRRLLLIIICACLAGCTSRQMPEYFLNNQGRVIYADSLEEHPLNSVWFTVYGYTLPSGEIHLKNMTPIDYILTLGTDIPLHEKAHSFEFILSRDRPGEWRRFKADFHGDMEDFAHAVCRGNNKYVKKFISGKYNAAAPKH